MARISMFVSVLAFAGLLFLTCAGAQQKMPGTQLTLSVFNDAGLPEKVIHDARDRTEFILLRAGVSLTWIDCAMPTGLIGSSDCSRISYPEHLSVRLVSGSPPASGDTFGQSFLNAEGEGSYAIVYMAAVRGSTATSFLREGDLLGDVIAHEVGHLLLGPNSHGKTGIMNGHWQPPELQLAAKGLLVFTQEEARRIRARYEPAMARSKARAESSEWRAGD